MAASDFKHISVTAVDEDDFVIRAGVSDEADVPADAAHAPAASPEAVSEPRNTTPPDAAQTQDSLPRQGKPPRPSAPKSAASYEGTTLEDLTSEKMPFAQKVVIVAAIVCIIGAVVYYFAFMS